MVVAVEVVVVVVVVAKVVVVAVVLVVVVVLVVEVVVVVVVVESSTNSFWRQVATDDVVHDSPYHKITSIGTLPSPAFHEITAMKNKASLSE